MGVLTPDLPDFDLAEWRAQPWQKRLAMACQDWGVKGFGSPLVVYAFYLVKMAVYVGAWIGFVVTTAGVGSVGDIGQWWALPIAFQKAILWTLTFELLGLGCGSGPLTGRFNPPVAGFLHFLRPGTIRLAPWPNLPGTAGTTRTRFDVALYGAEIVLLSRALLADSMTVGVILPILLVMAVMGLRDKTLFLAARGEHYVVTTIVFLFPSDVIAGSQAVQFGLWFWAATSKLTHHLPAVIAVMTSNHSILRFRWLRTRMYVDYPTDMRPSTTAANIAHFATAVEYGFPIMLLLGNGGWVTTIGLTVMVCFHLMILTSIPMGVPLEWNVMFMYSGFVLFGEYADIKPWDMESPWLALILLVALVVIPIVGNRVPSRVSFLPSMRYYAGNWAFSVWCLRPEALRKIETTITTVAVDMESQIQEMYGADVAEALMARGMAFRHMHLQGRVLHDLIPRAVDDVEAYKLRDGETLAGLALGWNFGDGHLHHEQLMAALQQRCHFGQGDVVGIFIESQPLFSGEMAWRIVDAATGRIDQGVTRIEDLRERQPWPPVAAAERP
jgi:hypothetical protein